MTHSSCGLIHEIHLLLVSVCCSLDLILHFLDSFKSPILKKAKYLGLNMKCPHRLMCLNTCCPYGPAVLGGCKTPGTCSLDSRIEGLDWLRLLPELHAS